MNTEKIKLMLESNDREIVNLAKSILFPDTIKIKINLSIDATYTGDWYDGSTWDNGVPYIDCDTRIVITPIVDDVLTDIELVYYIHHSDKEHSDILGDIESEIVKFCSQYEDPFDYDYDDLIDILGDNIDIECYEEISFILTYKDNGDEDDDIIEITDYSTVK